MDFRSSRVWQEIGDVSEGSQKCIRVDYLFSISIIGEFYTNIVKFNYLHLPGNLSVHCFFLYLKNLVVIINVEMNIICIFIKDILLS